MSEPMVRLSTKSYSPVQYSNPPMIKADSMVPTKANTCNTKRDKGKHAG